MRPQPGLPQPEHSQPGHAAPSPAPAAAPGHEAARTLILVTRPEPGASAAAVLLRARGLDPVVAPFLAVSARTPALPHPSRLQAVLAASGRALDLPGAPPGLLALPLLAVGDTTAARAIARGFATVHSADGDAAALAALAARLCDPAGPALLLLCGASQGHRLAALLRGRGFRVARRVAYAARPVAHFPAAAAAALAGGRTRAVLFLSAETARSFVATLPPALVPALAPVDAVAIGGAAAAALHALPWRHVHVAHHPTLDGVLALL